MPILILNCSEEFEENAENRERMLVKVRNFLRKVEFFEEGEEMVSEPDLKKSKSFGSESSATLQSMDSVNSISECKGAKVHDVVANGAGAAEETA